MYRLAGVNVPVILRCFQWSIRLTNQLNRSIVSDWSREMPNVLFLFERFCLLIAAGQDEKEAKRTIFSFNDRKVLFFHD
jgi:hypothetical protein